MTAASQQVFISYQRTDAEFARQVREHLVETGVRAWMDQYDIPVGAYWPDEIDRALISSDIVVGILSPDAVESRNVKNEWDWAIQNDKRLLLLQVEPCVIPHRYVSINFIDVTGSDASLALSALAETLGVSAIGEDDFQVPETQYAQSNGVTIAYQIAGDGPLDVVYVPGIFSNVEVEWEWPEWAHFYRRLASMSRLIRFDKRGTGLSDRVSEADIPTLETRMDDVRAVMDAAGSERAVIFGVSEGGPMSILFAATYPERTLGLMMFGAVVKGSPSPDCPWAFDPKPTLDYLEDIYDQRDQETDLYLGQTPDPVSNEDFQRWARRRIRLSASPGAAKTLVHMNAEIDVRSLVSSIRVPTLILQNAHDPVVTVEHGRYLGEHIPGARYLELDGDTHGYFHDPGPILTEMEQFLDRVQPRPTPDRVLGTVLSLDGRASDAEPRSDGFGIASVLRQNLVSYRGREIELDDAHLVATFDGPSRAIRCAASILRESAVTRAKIRAGVHTGEVEMTADGLRGLAVNIAGAVAATAKPDEIIASRTVKDLVAGSGIVFEDRGIHTFDGIPDEWQLFRVDPESV